MMRSRILLFLLISLLLFACSTSPTQDGPPQMSGFEDTPLPVDPLVTVGTLDNGLTYFIRENTEPENRAFLRLVVNAGSIQEDDDQLGLAHFLEHMAFNGTQSYSGNDIIDFLERLGMQFGPDINAYTSFDETVYQLDVPTDRAQTFDTAMNVLYEWAALMTLDPEEIDKERGVIVEEWRFRRGANARMRDEQYPVLFGDSRYAERLPIGDVDLIRTFEPAVLERFYRDWYRPELMAIVAVGDFDSRDVEEQIAEIFSRIEPADDPRPREVFDVPPHEETRFVVADDPETSYTTASLYVKRDAEELRDREDYRGRLMSQLFSSMFNSRLAEIAREPDAPFLDASVSSGPLVRTEAAAALSAAVEGNDVAPAIESLLIETRRINEHGFTETELDRAKRNALRSIEQTYRERENLHSRSFADEYVRAYLENEAIPGIPAERELYEELLPDITLAELNELAETYLQEENRVVMVSAIESDELSDVTEQELREVFEQAQLVDVEPYVDRAVADRILPVVPAPGEVVSERDLALDGAYSWTMSNGAEVIVYPTEHRSDQVLMSAFSPGGSSTVAMDRFRSAQYATTFTEQMGYGDFSPPDLERALAGRALSVTPFIDSYEEGLSGSSSVEDLETMLQLLHLKMTTPRRDEATFAALQNQFRAAIANQTNQPAFQFSRRFQELYNDGNPRALPIASEGIDSISIDDVLDIYSERFGDASDFTFVFVGNIDLARFRQMTERYIASLPGLDTDPGWRNVGIDRPESTVTDTVRSGIEPIAEVAIAFYGDYEFSQQNNYRIRALERMLSIRMQEEIREDESGTYGVGVQAVFDQVPEERYGMLITFRADPERIEELTDSVFGVIDELRTTVPDRNYVERIQETQRATFEEGLTSNQFWLGQIEYAARNGRELDSIEQYLDLVDSLQARDITEAAQQLLDNDRFVQVTLLPAEAEAE
ncbi:MAG: M16 family metallopeptidase [bacterium]